MKSHALPAVFALAAILVGGCDQSAAPTSQGANTPAAGAGGPAATGVRLPEGLVVRAAVANATPVGACKSSAKVGDSVVMLGRIGGKVSPFASSRAVFSIVDPSLKACSDEAGDTCKTPWDYCCEPAESLARNMATVEIVGADGKPLQFSVRGVSGLDPLASVAITGKVMERNDQGLFVVRAEKISIQ